MTPKIVARYWSYVDKRGADDCWPWMTQPKSRAPRFRIGVEKHGVHQIALMLTGKDRPFREAGALHSCDNSRCCNPRHLRWGTPLENAADKIERDRVSRHGKGGKRGGAHHCAKLSDEIVQIIHTSPLGYKALARHLGVNRTTIRSVRRGNTWVHAE